MAFSPLESSFSHSLCLLNLFPSYSNFIPICPTSTIHIYTHPPTHPSKPIHPLTIHCPCPPSIHTHHSIFFSYFWILSTVKGKRITGMLLSFVKLFLKTYLSPIEETSPSLAGEFVEFHTFYLILWLSLRLVVWAVNYCKQGCFPLVFNPLYYLVYYPACNGQLRNICCELNGKE